MTAPEYMQEAALLAMDCAEQRLCGPCSVADMAAAAHYSLFHFCRVFQRVVRLSPYEYLMLRRLSECARAIRETDRKLIEIGGDYGFQSPETFLRAFRRKFGVLPSQWREGLGGQPLFPRLTAGHLALWNSPDYVPPEVRMCEAGQFSGVGVAGGLDDIPHWRGVLREMVGGQTEACCIGVSRLHGTGRPYLRLGVPGEHPALPVQWSSPPGQYLCAPVVSLHAVPLMLDYLRHIWARTAEYAPRHDVLELRFEDLSADSPELRVPVASGRAGVCHPETIQQS